MQDRMDGLKRTHYCAEVRQSDVGHEVVVCGFAHKVRDMGSLLFLDLRDRSGILQLAFDEDTPKEVFYKAQTVRSEFVLMVRGMVRKRASVNLELETGSIEVAVLELKILSRADVLPFEIKDDVNAREELRLKYRYLDLRRPILQKALMLRNQVTAYAHEYFRKNGFIEVQTPELIKSTPEGARDYLVPSRQFVGSFFALPQSPQLYKQLLMVAGIDRYMQIAKCFRDEDLRADRQPEFTQIDLEMSFVDEEDVLSINEKFVSELFAKTLGVSLQTPFLRMTYGEAMQRFGTDKPDVRFGLELIDLSDALAQSDFAVFKNALAGGGLVMAINVKGAAKEITRKEIDKLTEMVKTYKAGGLAYARLLPESETSSYEKFLSDQEKKGVRIKTDAQVGDLVLIVADSNPNVVFSSLGNLRLHLAQRLELTSKKQFAPLWVTEFPLFEWSEEEKRFTAMHHPFTSPNLADIDLLDTDPKKLRARAYDLVLNGCEVGGGSIRISEPRLQQKVFSLLGISPEEALQKFGFLLEAFRFGVPPHGGMAYGLDRLLMLMLGRNSIREVIAFPKVQNSGELMSGCPAPIDEKCLEELGIKCKD